ncbi:MAG: LytTR family DNA-binding domain-containing protein [Bacteroidota bacterium]|nr:LytTR family DNA-binding domain-containing protein [Bacteroidota bacterium]MDP3144947.1 LytTR family DNA-binding domain-containing protein [Bacteroidota bacterium]MDP3557040.1 LytTR family DNA-binding domain-containing protein [Bacteroidota bacterium]
MFNAIIIEDEYPARITLKSYLERYFSNIEVVAEIETVLEAIPFIKNNKIDIIFLDVQLKDGKGIEVLENIDSEKYKIIFTTAHEEYTLNAFKHKAFGYLLKPLDPTDFKEIVERVLNDLNANNAIDLEKKIKIPEGSGYIWIELKDIIRCEAYGNYTKIITKENLNAITVSKTLKYVEQNLIKSDKFIRVHQSHLINLSFIKAKEIKNNTIALLNGEKIPVSRAKRNNLFDNFQ